MPKPAKPLRSVEVIWEDSTMLSTGWKSPGEVREWMKQDIAHVETVGYLVKKTKRKVVILQSFHNGLQFMNAIQIPRGCVLSIRKLR